MNLAGRSAIVTGGAVRIGRTIARSLAAAGMNVCIHYRHSEAEAREAVEELKTLGVRATSFRADFLSPVEAGRNLVRHAAGELGEVSVLVNGAAIFEPGSLRGTDEGNWDRHLNINLKAPFFLTQEFVRQLGPDAEAAVVNVVDWRGTRPVPGHAAYTLAKSALVAQTRLLAQELGPRIRVNAVAPGAILPGPGEDAAAFRRRGEENPLRRVGTPDDVAEAVRFLLHSPFVTGEILHVTGGEQLGIVPPVHGR